ncbi:uncharacterized protein LAJ45_09901 [Morchella importuna]|uniref:uncharacterized protein n=1 Tax=Morchella importuna TaxID=1174673 RepID=UPI001E8D0D10|nr:uncharacterized protein LAJ45_09901 [Morchella importuna]KAH8145979.1 hypothetical protein LAJ45_09901 [Morchella importuna]
MPQTASTSSSSFVWGCMVCSNTFVGENGFHTHFSRISAKEAKGGAGLHLLAAGAKDVTPLWRRIPLEAKYAWPERMLLDSTQWDLVRAYLKGPDGGIKKIRAALDDYLVHSRYTPQAAPEQPPESPGSPAYKTCAHLDTQTLSGRLTLSERLPATDEETTPSDRFPSPELLSPGPWLRNNDSEFSTRFTAMVSPQW